MIINNARGSHSSPGVYTKEVDVTYSVKSLGITSLGLAGETVKGPAFEPIKLEKWSDFVDYFGSTSAEKVKGTGNPKYELPYIAKEYLKESKQLYVARVLGLSGYDAGPAWVICAKKDNAKYPVAILRSAAEYSDLEGDPCSGSGDTISFIVTGVTIGEYESKEFVSNCEGGASASSDSTNWSIVTVDNLGKFSLKVTTKDGTTSSYSVSLNAGDKDYIYNVFGTGPFSNETPLFVEEVYDYALLKMAEEEAAKPESGRTQISIDVETVIKEDNINDYKEPYRCAVTPWILSQLDAMISGTTYSASAKRLFRVYTLSDGNNANTEVKISIEKINPAEGTFDLVVRAMNDTDAYPKVLEKFSGCNFVRGDKNYLPLRVGSFDGLYELKSKYIAIEMSENEDLYGAVPAGFEGYPLHNISGTTAITVNYNTSFDKNIKAKRQYFGFSNISGIDYDIFSYKGAEDSALTISNAFHLDAILSTNEFSGATVYVDGEEKAASAFTTVDVNAGKDGANIPRIQKSMKNSLYEDIATRKFTVCFYGGFDGWDIYRKQRTNTDEFKATKYAGVAFDSIATVEGKSGLDLSFLGLPTNAINSDYYAYLGAYRLFSNPEDIDINAFGTPGIDWYNNLLLVEDALDVIEDPDDGRGGDAIHIITSPERDENGDVFTPEGLVSALEETSLDSSYAATYWPWVKYFDANENVYISLPVTKDVLRNLAYVDNTSYPWFAPAGVNRGNVNGVRATFKTRLSDEDTLYDGRINPVKTFAVDGIKIWGNKTLYSIDSPLNRVNVRRLMLRIKKLVTGVGKQLIFDQYDSSLKNQFLSLVTPILSNVKANGGIYDYYIEVDDSVEARDAHTLPCTIHVKPTPTLEYIDLTFTIYPESVDFRF